MTAVRCHAALIADSDRSVLVYDNSEDIWEERESPAGDKILVKYNVVVTYEDEQLPVDGSVVDVETCHAKVSPFTGECHSTVDFNGIAHIRQDRITFVPMAGVSDYLK